MKTVYDMLNGQPVIAFEDPRVPGHYVMPADSIEVKPPAFDPETQTCRWNGSQWELGVFVPLPPEPEYKPPPPEPPPPSAEEQLRSMRDSLLYQTDWWCASDQTPTPEQLAYRQALRDIPANCTPSLDEDGNLTGVTWPVKPE